MRAEKIPLMPDEFLFASPYSETTNDMLLTYHCLKAVVSGSISKSEALAMHDEQDVRQYWKTLSFPYAA